MTSEAGGVSGATKLNLAIPDGVVFDGSVPCEPPNELVKGLLPYEGVAFLGGQSGSGKTFIAVDLAVAVASADVESTAFFGRKVRERVGVVILAAEGAGTLPYRLEVARRHRRVTDSLPIAYVAEVGDLSDSATVAELLAKLVRVAAIFQKDWGVRLGVVIIDTVAAAFNMEDENDNAEAARIIRQMRLIGQRLAALTIAVHHYGKAAATGLRGASAFRAGADVIISVLAERDEITGEVGNRQIALAKSRTADEGPISGFDLRFVSLGVDEDGDSFGTCAVAANDLPQSGKPNRREAASKANFRAAFHEALARHGVEQLGITGDPAVLAVEVNHVREAMAQRLTTADDDLKKRAERVRKALARAIADLSEEFATSFADGLEWIWLKG